MYGSAVPVKAKRSAYAVRVDREGRLAREDAPPTTFPPDWTPEHLVLGGLARCVLTALAYHSRRAEVWMAASADASGVVTRRDDGSWGFVEIECSVDARLDPAPPELGDFLARAERGCFVGASLDPRPTYRWTVNGESVEAAALQ